MLLKSNMIQNWRSDLRFFLCMTGVTALLHFCQEVPTTIPLDFVVIMCLLVLGSMAFRHLAVTPSAISYLTLPASTSEKTISVILRYQIFYVVITILANIIGFWIAMGILNMIGSDAWMLMLDIYGRPEVDFTGFGWGLAALFPVLAGMTFGSVYFKKNAPLKNALACIAIFVVLLAINILILHFRNFTGGREIFTTSDQFKLTFLIVSVITTLFFWFMTWLRLRETEA